MRKSDIERKWEKESEYAKNFFKDQYLGKDYSNLEPWEAEDKLERLKERDGWVDDEIYYALSKISRGDYPIRVMPAEIQNGTDEELCNWFTNTFNETKGDFSISLMKEIGKRLKPYHESILLNDLKKVEPVNIPTWVSGCKEMGYFFSAKVYSACKRKYLSQFEKPQITK